MIGTRLPPSVGPITDCHHCPAYVPRSVCAGWEPDHPHAVPLLVFISDETRQAFGLGRCSPGGHHLRTLPTWIGHPDELLLWVRRALLIDLVLDLRAVQEPNRRPLTRFHAGRRIDAVSAFLDKKMGKQQFDGYIVVATEAFFRILRRRWIQRLDPKERSRKCVDEVGFIQRFAKDWPCSASEVRRRVGLFEELWLPCKVDEILWRGWRNRPRPRWVGPLLRRLNRYFPETVRHNTLRGSVSPIGMGSEIRRAILIAELLGIPECRKLRGLIARAALEGRPRRLIYGKRDPDVRDLIDVLDAARPQMPRKARIHLDIIRLWRREGMRVQAAIEKAGVTRTVRAGAVRTWWWRLRKAMASATYPRWLKTAAKRVKAAPHED